MRLTSPFRATPTVRGALAAGFTVVFALWLVSGYELLRGVRQLERRVAAVHDAAFRGNQVLGTIRTSILLGSIYLRDALIDPSSREYYRAELNRIRDEVDRILPTYQQAAASSQEREHWERLRTELEYYWQSRQLVFAPDAPRTPDEAAALLRQRVVPARNSILDIVDSLSALQQASRDRAERGASLLYASALRRVLWLAGLAVVAGLIVAVAASRHVGRLQIEIEQQRLAEEHNRRDLERLSARLVSAQEEERRSLARELHDAVGQALTAIKMEMGVALRAAEVDTRARASLEQARAIAETTLQSVRDLSQVLHPSMLDDFGLPETLRAYLRSVSSRSRIRTQLTLERMDDRLPQEVEVCVYRIVQEALTNVARHSGATVCTVSVIRRDDALHLLIEDDGCGIDPVQAATARRSLGLVGMRERAQALNGTFVIENRREGGTRVSVTLPTPSMFELAAARRKQLAG
ncbi:MAG: MCP four helix bundle domain-containing protein [Acidobacteria bacterium]|nr:MCP four helix bundle domain-containing protein [Acidobacteriota bacterium]